MGDLKSELGKIRGKVKAKDPKAGQTKEPGRPEIGSRADKKSSAKPHSRTGKHKPLSDRVLQVLKSMPLVGRVIDVQGDRGFGFVETSSGKTLFHVTNRFGGRKDPLQPTLHGKLILFALGTSPRSRQDKPQAVRWCPAQDAGLPIDSGYDFSVLYENYRRNWLNSLDAGELEKILQAGWYRNLWRSESPPTDLHDPLLEQRVLDLLLELSTEEILNSRLPSTLDQSPYSFAASWTGASGHLADFQFLRELPVEKLLCLGAPDPECLETLTGTPFVKAGLWGLQQEDEIKRQKFLERMNGRRAEEANIVRHLLDDGWQPSADDIRWVKRLVEAGHLNSSEILQLLKETPENLGVLYGLLDEEGKQEVHRGRFCSRTELVDLLTEQSGAAAVEALASHVVSIDLETDGQHVREIGIAYWGEEPVQYSEKAENLKEGERALVDALDHALLVVGHNIDAWDLTIIKRLFHAQPTGLVWDTLLIQFILSPWLATQSLGATHLAGEDAALALQRFVKQLEELPKDSILSILAGHCEDSADLVKLMVNQIGKTGWWLPDRTTALEKAIAAAKSGQHILAHPHIIRRFDWIKGVAVVPAVEAETLDPDFWAVSLERLESLTQAGLNSYKRATVLGVLRLAESQGISLRFNMLPYWLRSESELKGDEQETWIEALRLATCLPERSIEDCGYVSPFPQDVSWLSSAQGCSWSVIGYLPDHLVLDAGNLSLKKVPEFAANIVRNKESDIAAGTKGIFLHTNEEDSSSCWVYPDRVQFRLARTSDLYRILGSASVQGLDIQWLPPPDDPPDVRVLLPTPTGVCLYPNSLDPANYWIELVNRFSQSIHDVIEDSVPILLIGSTQSRELKQMLETALAELGLAELPKPHHAPAERLRRANARRHCLVDFEGSWVAWRELSEQLEVLVVPFLEVLPLEMFFAELHEDAVASDTHQHEQDFPDLVEVDSEDDEVADEAEDVPLPCPNLNQSAEEAEHEWVSIRKVHESIPRLLHGRLLEWLHQTGVSENREGKVFVLDSRVLEHSSRLKGLVEPMEIPTPFDANAQRVNLQEIFEPLAIQRQEPPTTLEEVQRFLINHWNRGREHGDPNFIYGFREQTQLPAIHAILPRNQHVVISLPTGEGKSVLFQVPALSRGLRNKRLSLVLSPLKALMKDQFQGLERLGFGSSVGYLSSDQSPVEISETLQGVLEHRIVLLYVAPERFRNPRFQDVIQRRAILDDGLEYVIFDEAHCISQWGYEFRPDYFHAIQFLQEMLGKLQLNESSPFLFFSATLTQTDRNVISRLMTTRESEPDRHEHGLEFVPAEFNDPIRDFIEIRPRQVHGGFDKWGSFENQVQSRIEIILDECDRMLTNRKDTAQHSSMIVFVGRRYHAELLSALVGRNRNGLKTAFYHAGMNEEDRSEVYEEFRSGRIDILVATKAFGMGMDIPHIHWAVHLTPPAYLEDYLQEVGRIGRGSGERQSARLDRLSAVLLFSEEDFETNRVLRNTGEINFQKIRDWMEVIRGNATETANGKSLAVLPEAGFETHESEPKERASATQLRMCLYWLEKAGKVEIVGMVPRVLPVTINIARTKELADGDSPTARVGRLIYSAYAQPDLHRGKSGRTSQPPDVGCEPASASNGKGFLNSLISAIGSVVSIFLPRNTQEPVPQTSSQRVSASIGQDPSKVRSAGQSTNIVTGLINVGQIFAEADLKSVDSALQEVSTLERLSALTLERMINVESKELGKQTSDSLVDFLDSVETISEFIIEKAASKNKFQIDWESIEQRFVDLTFSLTGNTNWSRHFKRTVRSALRASGARIHLEADDYGETSEFARLPPALRKRSKAQLRSIIAISRGLLTRLHSEIQGEILQIGLGKLIGIAATFSPNKRFDKGLLWKGLLLLSSASILKAPKDLLPQSYLIVLDAHEDELTEEEFKDLHDELVRVNKLSEQRINSMEVFANIPDDVRGDYIRDYFKSHGADELKSLMDSMLLEIDSDAEQVSSWISRMRDTIREESAIKVMRMFTDQPEEPNQWQAITRPARKSILVNAGPGSGKTAVLLARVFHLIRDQRLLPEQILVLAFNRAVIFELRSRLQQLFRTLGYPRYARRLKIYTFHGFAMRHLEVGEGVDLDEHRRTLLQNLANSLGSNPTIAREVTSGLRTILIDEFQDVDDDIFEIVAALKNAAGPEAGVFAIGDDDQDISFWRRCTEDGSARFSDYYFQRFLSMFSVAEEDQIPLRVNFRSSTDIVERSQEFIGRFFERFEGSTAREKDASLRPKADAETGEVTRLDCRKSDFSNLVQHAEKFCMELQDCEAVESAAVLCRTNAEVAEIFLSLSKQFKNVKLQAGVKAKLSSLRQLGLLKDLIDKRIEVTGNEILTDDLVRGLVSEFEDAGIAETVNPRVEDLQVEHIFTLARKEHARPSLQDVADLVSGMDTDEAERILGFERHGKRFIVVSTIHKVKGLEFDAVLVVNSCSPFPLNMNNNTFLDVADFSAEEARLYYVAMTRAKSRLRYLIGPREDAWWRQSRFEGEVGSQRMLTGDFREVWLSWPICSSSFNPDPEELQCYIEREVCVGDRIFLKGGYPARRLFHRSRAGIIRQIGMLARKAGGGHPSSELLVSAVVRWSIEEGEAQKGNLGPPCELVRERGWGYVVLVSGFLEKRQTNTD